MLGRGGLVQDGLDAEPRRRLTARSEIDVENRHREIVVPFVLVLEYETQKLVADVKLGRIILARARLHLEVGVLEDALEIGVELSDFFRLHGLLRLFWRVQASGTPKTAM